MVDLERRISGDWIDIREAAREQYSLIEHLAMSAQQLDRLADELRRAVEEGLLEYKGVVLRRVFITLEAVQFQSVRFEELQAREEPLKELLFLILLERLFCTGVIALARSKAGEAISGEDLDVNAVLADVRNRIEKDPGFQKHPAVKNIFMQIAVYQKERKKMAELLPAIQQDKKAVFRSNFQASFARVFDSIRRNYTDILKEEESRRLEKESRQDLLYRLPLKDLSPFLTNQAREVSRLRSTLAYAREDKYKTRAVLVKLYKQRDSFLKLIENEKRVYRTLCAEIGLTGAGCADGITNRLREELVRVLQLLARVEQVPQ